MYWACDNLVVGRIPTRVDSQYRSHRATVHDRPVYSSRDRPSTSSRARRAAASVREPPRRTRSFRPIRFVIDTWKYQLPCPPSASRGQVLPSRPLVGFLQPHRLKITPWLIMAIPPVL